jgi:hypothetical protein
MDKEGVINELDTRVNFMVNDCRTFYSAKTCRFNCCIGGGNFLSILGGFSLINLLSKVNNILNDGKAWDEREIVAIKTEGSKLAKGFKKHFHIPKVGNLKKNETDCFVELFMDTKSRIPWGFTTTQDAKKIWTAYRNKLTHIASPALSASALRPQDIVGVDFNKLVNAIHEADEGYIYGCNNADSCAGKAIAAEKLNEHLLDIWEIVKSKLETCGPEKILLINKLIF